MAEKLPERRPREIALPVLHQMSHAGLTGFERLVEILREVVGSSSAFLVICECVHDALTAMDVVLLRALTCLFVAYRQSRGNTPTHLWYR